MASVQQVLKLICLLHKGNDLHYLALFSLKCSNAINMIAYGCLFFKKEMCINGEGKEMSQWMCICFLHILILQRNGLFLSILKVKLQSKGKVSAIDYTGIVNANARLATQQP